jgi:hypothetical protein
VDREPEPTRGDSPRYANRIERRLARPVSIRVLMDQNFSSASARSATISISNTMDDRLPLSAWRRRLLFVLAIEVAMSQRQTEGAARNPPSDPQHEPGQPVVGHPADPWRTPRTRQSGNASHSDFGTARITASPPSALTDPERLGLFRFCCA